MQQNDQFAGFARRHDCVGTKDPQPVSGLLVGKSFACGDAKVRQHLVGRQCLRGIWQRRQWFVHTGFMPTHFFRRGGPKISKMGRDRLEPSQWRIGLNRDVR